MLVASFITKLRSTKGCVVNDLPLTLIQVDVLAFNQSYIRNAHLGRMIFLLMRPRKDVKLFPN